MKIRPYTPRDAQALTKIFHDSVHQIGSLDYSAQQLAAWSPKPASPERFAKRVSDGRDVLVAVDNYDNPLGFIELEPNGHIDYFYCSPKHAGTSVGSALYQKLERIAIDQSISSLFVEASEAAKRFFRKNGFTIESRHDFHHNGVQIHNYVMRKSLHH